MYKNIQYCIMCKCLWCGKEFDKSNLPNRVMYCSDNCRIEALREQKRVYQRKRRKRIREGTLIVKDTEKQVLGTTYLSKNRHKDFKREYRALQNELKRLHLNN